MEENIKLKSSSKGKERRQPYSQDGMSKRSTKSGLIKNDLSQLVPPQPQGDGSPIKKILSEANKIVKIGMEKDYALLERDNTLQSSNEMVDNLRKNILHLQMEYEKLDQNYQLEVSHRSEIVKRMDETQETIESIFECSNALSKSLKQLEADKFKIAEFYELIYQNQKEVEIKHSKIEKFLKEQDETLKTKMDNIKKSHDNNVSQYAETVSQLNRKLNYANDKMKVVSDENEKLEKKVQELQESSRRLEIYLERQERLNCLHEENVVNFKFTLKKVKIQRFKYQNLWKRKKMQIDTFIKKNKMLKKNLKKIELLYNQCSSTNETLEFKNFELEEKLEKLLEQDQTRFEKWDVEKRELNDKVLQKEAEIESLKEAYQNMSEKFTELTKNDGSKQIELEKVQNELSKLLSENLKLKDENLSLVQEGTNKSSIIADLQRKASTSDAEYISQIEFRKNENSQLQELVNKLKIQLSDLQKRLAFEKTEIKSVVSDYNQKFEEHARVSEQKIIDLEKLLEEKSVFIGKLESEKNHAAFENQKSVEELNKQLQSEKLKNQELIENLQSLKGRQEDTKKRLEKSEKQISDFLEKLTDVNTLNKALNRNQNELQTNVANLKKEIEIGKKSYEALEGEHRKAENELARMQKILEENASLKSSVAELKNLLEATQAKVEAYKVVVKKLESEKFEAKSSHSQEVSRSKSEQAHLGQMEEPAKMARDSSRLQEETPKKNLEQTENEPELTEIEKWHQTFTPPFQSGKKFLSTPRKIYLSTPQPSFRNLTPVQKKRDPYEFDSDSSVERLDQDKVLKVFTRQKKETKRETNKRSKAK